MERKASKPVAVVRVCVSTFVRVTTLDILKETSGENPAAFFGDENQMFWSPQLSLW